MGSPPGGANRKPKEGLKITVPQKKTRKFLLARFRVGSLYFRSSLRLFCVQ